MEDLKLVFQSVVDWLSQFFTTFNSNWFLQLILFLFVLSGIVNVILVLRGTKK